ncbi:MAG TPA: aldehyde dehydrogenase family protein [Firmicutes bacterium]|nr:aldehyde dehydrogenase family protein [Bacillota bacterium]
MAEKYNNFIGGEWVAPSTGEYVENINPANTNDIIGLFPRSSKEDVDRAVDSAFEAYKKWHLIPAPKRGLYLQRVGDILTRRKEEIARVMTREMGKILMETRGDVQEGIDTAYYTAGEGRRLFGETVPTELPNKFAMSVRMPVGVCGMITPWNFPIAIPTWKLFPALISGNTCVIKPATLTPASLALLMEVFEEAELPPGVVNMVCGTGSEVGEAIIDNPKVNRISFTGSAEIGKRIAERCGALLKPVSLEMGGKNAEIIMEDANLKLALEGALWGAFGTTGQRCTATSRLIVHRDVHDEVLKELVKRARGLKIGDGLDESIDMGPMVSEEQRKTVLEYIEIGKREGAKLVCGGGALTTGNYTRGFFIEPTIFDEVKPDMRIAQEEIFGPVLSVITVGSLEEAIDVLNNTQYGLSSSIYTRDVNRAFRAIRDIEAGITYINGPTIGAEIQLPFGGVKDTGNGHRESGTTVYDFYTEWKSVYIDYSGRLQRAQIDT